MHLLGGVGDGGIWADGAGQRGLHTHSKHFQVEFNLKNGPVHLSASAVCKQDACCCMAGGQVCKLMLVRGVAAGLVFVLQT